MAITYTVRWRAVGSDGAWSEATGLTGTSHPIDGLEAGVRYDVQVVARDTDGSEGTAIGARRTACAAPAPTAAPVGFRRTTGTDTDGAIDVSWLTVTGADHYAVQHRTADTGAGAGPWSSETTTATTGVRIGGLATDAGRTYDVRVVAINDELDRSAETGIAAAAVPLIASSGSGGSVAAFTGADGIGEDGVVYVVHAFRHDPDVVNEDGRTEVALTLNRTVTLDHLVIGGGGGGGGHIAGGGGAGEVVQRLSGSPEVTVAATPVTLTMAVGGGGLGGFRSAGSPGTGTASGDGADGTSTIAFVGASFEVTARGGGGGGNIYRSGRAGGSGGGEGSVTTAGAGSATATAPGSGSGGGSGVDGSCATALAGGGGGAGATGGSASLDRGDGGDGGDGIEVTLLPEATAVELGIGEQTVSGVMVGGGGGGGVNAGAGCVAAGGPGAGGAGGGGAGGPNVQSVTNADTAGRDGVDTTGGGGGGASGNGAEPGVRSGGAGGTGLVLVRYRIPAPPT